MTHTATKQADTAISRRLTFQELTAMCEYGKNVILYIIFNSKEKENFIWFKHSRALSDALNMFEYFHLMSVTRHF